MNSITDLTARAVSFITAIQTVFLKGAVYNKEEEKKRSIFTVNLGEFSDIMRDYINEEDKVDFKDLNKESFSTKALELVWVSSKKPEVVFAREYVLAISKDLVEWVQINKLIVESKLYNHQAKYSYNEEMSNVSNNKYGLFPTPFVWRQVIQKILYTNPEVRLELADKLQYMPVRIMLACGSWRYSPRDQRILQLWNVDEENKKKLLDYWEIKTYNHFIESVKKANIKALLQDDEALFQQLKKSKVPFSFETVFKDELIEIEANRKWRLREVYITDNDELIKVKKEEYYDKINDPFQKAKEMELSALTFSGGGIRSATFNLGILQGLAKYNVLKKFDYLSTVSGGGYIGSWLATWIKRDESFVKVNNRLCPDKSPEPLSEELRPIKWLRMFSNYFAPNASIMSVDTWTIIVTWLRNTLLNQVMIFLLLLSLLFTGNFFYELWRTHPVINFNPPDVKMWSLILLLPVAMLAGFGMHAYKKGGLPGVKLAKDYTGVISIIIWTIAFIGAYLLSYFMSLNNGLHNTNTEKLKLLLPAAKITFLMLLLPAAIGRYDKCIIESLPNRENMNARIYTTILKIYDRIYAIVFIIISSLIAATVGLFCLAGMWSILQAIETSSSVSYVCKNKDAIQFILGLPIALEVFSVVIVIRMALLGKYFPDERREWWGRIGGYVHRFAFLWILIIASALLGKDLVINIFNKWWVGVTATGGWLMLVTTAVKSAFSAKTSGKESANSSSAYLNIISLIGPYIFILGLLVFLPGLIDPIHAKEQAIIHSIYKYFNSAPAEIFNNIPFQIFLLIIFISATLLFLSWRIGVNEFSMHHFYKNRLVRAYLGASRRAANRQITFNPFTGFDMLDDEKLSTMLNKNGYYGPYPVLNTALNASDVIDLDRQDRKAESFIFSPLYCGFDFSMIKASANTKIKSYDYGYRQTNEYAYKEGPSIGTAMAISGAAVNPNHGYHSSAATAFLLTVFNLQMGWWIGNPRQGKWDSSDPELGLSYIAYNLMGKSNTRRNYVALSDGGHFDNMGLYEMIRRRCKYIVVCDAEQDDNFTCEGFANAIRRCRVDFGAEIKINISAITDRSDDKYSKAHYAIGDITYPDIEEVKGKLLYIKASITDDEDVDIYEYSKKNKTFPQQTTADQFFDEEQFESYRKLGLHIISVALDDNNVKSFFELNVKNDDNNIPNKNFKTFIKDSIERIKNFIQSNE